MSKYAHKLSLFVLSYMICSGRNVYAMSFEYHNNKCVSGSDPVLSLIRYVCYLIIGESICHSNIAWRTVDRLIYIQAKYNAYQ